MAASHFSLLWQIPLGLMLLALAWLFVSLAFRIGKTLKSVESLVDKEVGSLLKNVNQTVQEVNRDLPQLLENVKSITASIQQISESELQPMTHNIQEMTEVVNQNVAKMDELINGIADFSQTTVKRAAYYRDQLSIPITDVISLWSGIKAGWEVFRGYRKPKASDSEGETQQEQS